MTVDRLKNFQCDEVRRVQAIIRRDQSDQNRDDIRKLAELKIRDGLSVDLLDTVIEPTPEWLGQGEHVSFTAPVPERSAKVVTTRRRVVAGQAFRAWRAGRMDADQFRACVWYQDQYERAGLDGKVPSADMAREVRGAGTAGFVFTESQIIAQTNLRAARAAIKLRFVKLFELVVLHDIAVDRARRVAPSGRFPWTHLTDAASAVHAKLQQVDPDYKISLTDVC